jgi:integrase
VLELIEATRRRAYQARADTSRVCTHSMRGLHATLAIDAGITPPVVASALGHASVRATLLSYADPSTVARANQRRVLASVDRRKPRNRRPEDGPGKTVGKTNPRVATETKERARN